MTVSDSSTLTQLTTVLDTSESAPHEPETDRSPAPLTGERLFASRESDVSSFSKRRFELLAEDVPGIRIGGIRWRESPDNLKIPQEGDAVLVVCGGVIQLEVLLPCGTAAVLEEFIRSLDSQQLSGSLESIVTMESIKSSCVKSPFTRTLSPCHLMGRISSFRTFSRRGIRGRKCGETYGIMSAVQPKLD